MKNPLLISIFGIAVAGIAFGLIGPVTVILLEKNGSPSWITGTVTTMGYLSIVLFSSYSGKLIDRMGLKNILTIGLVTIICCSFGLLFWRNYFILFPVRFTMGIGVTFVFVATEVLINAISTEQNRGRNISLYVIFLSAGIAVGTLLIWTVQIREWLPFIIGACIITFVLIVELLLLTEFNHIEKHSSPKHFPLKLMPIAALLSAAVYGIYESAVTLVIPLYGLRSAFSENQVSYFLASYVIGGVVLLYFIGKVSDKISKFRLLLYISVIIALLFILPGVFIQPVPLIIIFFLIGGIVPAFYTIGLAYTIERVNKADIAQANGHFAMFYGVGTLIGPILGSMTVEFNRNWGFWISAFLLALIFWFYLSFFYKENS